MKDRLNIQLLTAAILSIGGLAMLFCGVFIDPEGQIHESLLIGFGEVATFAGSIMGVDYTYRFKKGPSKKDQVKDNYGNNINQTKKNLKSKISNLKSCHSWHAVPPLRPEQPPHV